MKFEYKIGDKVCRRSNRERKGVVTQADDEYEIKVHWSDMQNPLWAETVSLMPDTDEALAQITEYAKEVQSKIDSATSSLEAAFKAWQEAKNMYASEQMIMQDSFVDTKGFEGIINQFGWDTSSLYC